MSLDGSGMVLRRQLAFSDFLTRLENPLFLGKCAVWSLSSWGTSCWLCFLVTVHWRAHRTGVCWIFCCFVFEDHTDLKPDFLVIFGFWCVGVGSCPHRCHKSMSCVFSVTLHLIFWGRVSHHTWSSHFGYIELTRKLPGIACLCVTGVQHHAWLFLRCLGLWSQVLYPPAIPRPLPSKFKCFINMSRTFIYIDFWIVICICKYWFCLYTLTFKYVSLPRTMSSCSFRLLHIHVFYPVQAYSKIQKVMVYSLFSPFLKTSAFRKLGYLSSTGSGNGRSDQGCSCGSVSGTVHGRCCRVLLKEQPVVNTAPFLKFRLFWILLHTWPGTQFSFAL